MISLNQKSYATCIQYLVEVINTEKLDNRPQTITFEIEGIFVMLLKLHKPPEVSFVGMKINSLRHICKNINKAHKFQVMDIGLEGMKAGLRSVNHIWDDSKKQILLSNIETFDSKTIEYLESLYS
jgi:hypothetical protein